MFTVLLSPKRVCFAPDARVDQLAQLERPHSVVLEEAARELKSGQRLSTVQSLRSNWHGVSDGTAAAKTRCRPLPKGKERRILDSHRGL